MLRKDGCLVRAEVCLWSSLHGTSGHTAFQKMKWEFLVPRKQNHYLKSNIFVSMCVCVFECMCVRERVFAGVVCEHVWVYVTVYVWVCVCTLVSDVVRLSGQWASRTCLSCPYLPVFLSMAPHPPSRTCYFCVLLVWPELGSSSSHSEHLPKWAVSLDA